MSIYTIARQPGVKRQGSPLSRPETGTQPEQAGATRGFAKVPFEILREPKLVDRALRVWIALKFWDWRNSHPTNEGIANACGWTTRSGKPPISKVKDCIRRLIKLKLVERQVEIIDGVVVRTVLKPLDFVPPQVDPDPAQADGPDLTPPRVKSHLGGGRNFTRGGGRNFTPSLDRCRRSIQDLKETTGEIEESGQTTTNGKAEETTTTTPASPLPPTPTPERAEVHPIPGDGRRFLAELPPELCAVFEAETPRSRASILKRFEMGAEFGLVFADVVALLKRRSEAISSPPRITNPAQDARSLMQAAAEGDPLAPIHLAQRLVLDFGGDHKSRRAFEKLGKDLLLKARTVDEVWHAYTKATGPAARNPGAIFNVELRGNIRAYKT